MLGVNNYLAKRDTSEKYSYRFVKQASKPGTFILFPFTE
jgi:hypothetical protein